MADRELEVVSATILELDPQGERIGSILRQTLDQLYDGQHTGRYRWDQLHKTEKTHCGTLVEINLHREFGFEDGASMDYRIGGIDVDCKYSQSIGGWMIPLEAMGHLCLLIWADDQLSRWRLGIVRIEEAILSKGGNRDSKRSISASGRERIQWIFEDAPLPPNILLQLPRETIDEIMALPNGQQRIDQIFRVAQQMRIGRGVIATLGQQDDYMKRVRGNGGSRTRLKPEGIIILGHYEEHRRIAQSLGVPAPSRGEMVSVRVVPADADDDRVAELDGKLWRIATADDPIVEAPECPHAR
ncbi:MAG TPA: NaeI family type II restriction endonuclease [Planctomycetaceae bacterium]|nr:NaeI family type II restriction endonuclease [Planctomycetaceae bacterium]